MLDPAVNDDGCYSHTLHWGIIYASKNNNLAQFNLIWSTTLSLGHKTVGIFGGDDASSMHHLHWSIQLTYRITIAALGTSIDR